MMWLFVAFILLIIPLNSVSCSVPSERISVSKLPTVPLVQGSPWACGLCTTIIASLQPLVFSSEVDLLGRRAVQYFCSLQTTDPQDFFLCKVIVYNFVKLALNEFYHLDQREVCEHLTFCPEEPLPVQKNEELLSRSVVPTECITAVLDIIRMALPRSTPHVSSPSLPSIQAPSITVGNEI
ncbi:hypothetical protein EG68_04957 [Paragonimus skrjabini miyazakii]|uniref:Saposin B-type domain-containing protein n=1 Tax=Paragonimus skrjabini miyazakii TaxID=59628 RepID=A0A8S9YS52_9TREM|nr:hypothetical protein EG68_04957 [Paragonimus skrjabini miyazakii]